MNEECAAQFVSCLAKSIQALCSGYVTFSSSIEVIGHIHLNVDKNVRLDYILTEEVSKNVHEDETFFSSHSYLSKPPLQNASHGAAKSPGHSRRKSLLVPRVDETDESTLSQTVYPVVRPYLQDNTLHLSVSNPLCAVTNVESLSREVGNEPSASQVTDMSQVTIESVTSLGQVRQHEKTPLALKVVHPSVSYSCDSDCTSTDTQKPGVVVIKKEPVDDDNLAADYEDAPECFGSTDSSQEAPGLGNSCTRAYTTSALPASPVFQSDLLTRDSIVLENLDGEVKAVVAGNEGVQMGHPPFPVMLHTSPRAVISGVAVPGPSAVTTAVSTSQGAVTTAAHTMQKKRIQPGYKDGRDGGSKRRIKMTSKKIASAGVLFQDSKRSGERVPAVPKSHPQYYKAAANYMEYTVDEINEAIELVHGGMTVMDAAMKFGIPRATLFNRSRDGCKTHSGRCSEVFARTHFSENRSRRHKMVQYTYATMEKAIEAVHKGMPVIDAAILYDIPRASLFIRSSKGCPSHPGRCSTVVSNGKLRRSKVSRFKYQKLMQDKSRLKLDAMALPSSDERTRPVAVSESPSHMEQRTEQPVTGNGAVSAVPVDQDVHSVVAPLNVTAPESEAADQQDEEVQQTEVVMEVDTSDDNDKRPLKPYFDALTSSVVVKLERASGDDFYR